MNTCARVRLTPARKTTFDPSLFRAMASVRLWLRMCGTVGTVTLLGWGLMKAITPTPEHFKQVSATNILEHC